MYMSSVKYSYYVDVVFIIIEVFSRLNFIHSTSQFLAVVEKGNVHYERKLHFFKKKNGCVGKGNILLLYL